MSDIQFNSLSCLDETISDLISVKTTPGWITRLLAMYCMFSWRSSKMGYYFSPAPGLLGCYGQCGQKYGMQCWVNLAHPVGLTLLF